MQASLKYMVAAMLLLAGFCLPAAQAKPLPDRLQAVLDEYAQLDQAGQSQWLAGLIRRRAEPACRVTLSGKQFNHQIDLYRATLERARGQAIDTADIRKLCEDVDQQENAAIEILSRKFRFVTERGLRDDRSQYELRMNAWRNVQKRWALAGASWTQQPKMMQWLENAITQQQISTDKPLAAPPDFNAPIKSRSVAGETSLADWPRSQRTADVTDFQNDASELRGRIASYNLAVAVVVDELTDSHSFNSARLNRIASRLAELSIVQTELNLRNDQLSPNEQASGSRIEPLKPVILQAELAASMARNQLEASTIASSTKPQEDEIRALLVVGRRLRQLVPYLEVPVVPFYVP